MEKYDITEKCQIIEISQERFGFLLEGVRIFGNLEYYVLFRLIKESEK
jgi:hypothetical protein